MKNKLGFIVILIFAFTKTFGQTFIPPVLPQTGKATADFIPKGYTLLESTTGDLNNDGLPDVAFVMQSKDTFDEFRPDSFSLRSKPRILVVLFKSQSVYHLAVQNNTFILRYGEGGMDPEPFGSIEIDSGLLYIHFQFVRSGSEYKFRYQDNSFYLIWATEGGVWSDQFEGWELDFITKKAKHSWGEIEDDTKTKEESKEIKISALKKLSDMQMPGLWEVIPGAFL